MHSNFQYDICFIRISNDVDFYAVFPMISLVLTASFLVFLSIFSFLHQNIYNVRRIVFFANWLVAYFTHNTGKVPVVDPPEFQHFSLLLINILRPFLELRRLCKSE